MRLYNQKSIIVNGVEYKIDSDFRTALLIMQMYNDKALSNLYKHMCMLEMLFTTYNEDTDEFETNIPEDIEAAIYEGIKYLNCGEEPKEEDSKGPQLIDYEKDIDLIFSAIIRSTGKDLREVNYEHWATFVDRCRELDENSTIVYIADIRNAIAKGEKLEKHQEEFLKNNEDKVLISSVSITKDEFEESLQRELERLKLEKHETETKIENSDELKISEEDKKKLEQFLHGKGFNVNEDGGVTSEHS